MNIKASLEVIFQNKRFDHHDLITAYRTALKTRITLADFGPGNIAASSRGGASTVPAWSGKF